MGGNCNRLSVGGRIDRNSPVSFRFNGEYLLGYAGDTLASALLANGKRLVARSFKYHRPRGIMSAGVEETNALVQRLGKSEEPNVLATRLQLSDGLEVESVNCWPGLYFDLGVVSDSLSRLIPAGFYYKTFMWRPWSSYATYIRRAAGLGRIPETASVESYEKCYHHCEILIVGAGPAGLAAGLVAGRSGARVLIVDEQVEPGGQLLNEAMEIGDESALAWVKRVVNELDALPNVRRLVDSTVAGYYDHNMLTVIERSPEQDWLRERLWRVRAQRVLIATGAVERPLVFPDNDRPGIMLAYSVSAYLHRYGVQVGDQVVIATNNNSAYRTAFDLARTCRNVRAIIDTRPAIARELQKQSDAYGIEVLTGSGVVGVSGRNAVKRVDVAPLNRQSDKRPINCDIVCCSGGWNPVVHLHSHSGATPVYDSDLACFVPGESVQPSWCVGAAQGIFDLKGCLTDGFDKGSRALESLGLSARTLDLPDLPTTLPLDVQPIWELARTAGRKAFVDFQNDVTTDDLRLAIRENFVSVEHAKRYTTAGMAIDQGKTGNTNVIGFIAEQLGVEAASVGTTTYRPPYLPVSFGTIAGSHGGPLIIPVRRTPITQWHVDAGASMNEAGANFRRPFFYPRAGEDMASAVRREAQAVRQGAGIYDGTPLGKFELHGPDVVTFLNRVYSNSWDDLEVGQGRFGLMLREDGRLLDDGVTFRLGQDHYLLSSGSGTAETVYAHLEQLLQIVWPQLRVYVTTVTSQWANICLCGPRAREILSDAGTDIDLGSDVFPFLTLQEGCVAGYPARVARVSYTGELSFEINVRRRDGLALWKALMAAGEPMDITPVGSETSGVLRIEKGYVSVGSEGDNITNPFDAGMGWVVNMEKTDFIGKRSLVRDLAVGGQRQQVVGLLPSDKRFVMVEGSAIIEPNRDLEELPIFLGHVTASCYSPNLERSIALALLKNGRGCYDRTVTVSGLERTVEATVTHPVFIDAKGQRMRS